MTLPEPGTWIRITGGILATPQGDGLDGIAPGPLPKTLRGSIALIEKWEGSLKVPTGYDESFHGPLPCNSGEGRRIREVAGAYGVAKVMSGPLKGTTLNRDLLEFERLSPLEIIAAQKII